MIDLKAQTPTIQDCLGAIPVCQQVYEESVISPGSGNYPNEINENNSCLGGGEVFSIWYSFTVNRTGDFGFLLTPNDSNDDYDWGLFNITNATCADIRSNRSLAVSCNAAGGTNTDGLACSGETGAVSTGRYSIQGGGCFNSPPNQQAGNSPFNELIRVQAGNTYVLMVSNWSKSGNGYKIDFGTSNVGIFDSENPILSEVIPPIECGDKSIDLTFNENIQCSSVNLDNFELVAPDGNTYAATSIESTVCEQGGSYDRFFRVNFNDGYVANGNYTLRVLSDAADDLIDNCGNSHTSSEWSFSISHLNLPVVELGTVSDPLCPSELLVLDATTANATYLWQDGSTGANLRVTATGTYAVTVTDDCGSSSDDITVQFDPRIDFQFPEDILGCPGEDVSIEVTTPDANITWDDGSIGSTRVINQPGTYQANIETRCENVSRSVTVPFIALADYQLGNDTTICGGQSLEIGVDIVGATYSWSSGQNTPTIQADQSANYVLDITHQCGSISLTQSLEVLAPIDINLGNNRVICAGNPVLLNASTPRSISYQWQDGSRDSVLLAFQPGNYSVIIDNGCEVAQTSVALFDCNTCFTHLPNAITPNGDGVNDQFEVFTECNLNDFNMQIFNRWGEMIFESKSQNINWDGIFSGDLVQKGSYVYKLEYTILEADVSRGITKTGIVHVLQ